MALLAGRTQRGCGGLALVHAVQAVHVALQRAVVVACHCFFLGDFRALGFRAARLVRMKWRFWRMARSADAVDLHSYMPYRLCMSYSSAPSWWLAVTASVLMLMFICAALLASVAPASAGLGLTGRTQRHKPGLCDCT